MSVPDRGYSRNAFCALIHDHPLYRFGTDNSIKRRRGYTRLMGPNLPFSEMILILQVLSTCVLNDVNDYHMICPLQLNDVNNYHMIYPLKWNDVNNYHIIYPLTLNDVNDFITSSTD